MQWHTGMAVLSHKDVVLDRATSQMTMSLQAFPVSRGSGTLAPSSLGAANAPPAKRLRIALVGNLLVGAHMSHQPKRGEAMVRIPHSTMNRNREGWRGGGISHT